MYLTVITFLAVFSGLPDLCFSVPVCLSMLVWQLVSLTGMVSTLSSSSSSLVQSPLSSDEDDAHSPDETWWSRELSHPGMWVGSCDDTGGEGQVWGAVFDFRVLPCPPEHSFRTGPEGWNCPTVETAGCSWTAGATEKDAVYRAGETVALIAPCWVDGAAAAAANCWVKWCVSPSAPSRDYTDVWDTKAERE